MYRGFGLAAVDQGLTLLRDIPPFSHHVSCFLSLLQLNYQIKPKNVFQKKKIVLLNTFTMSQSASYFLIGQSLRQL